MEVEENYKKKLLLIFLEVIKNIVYLKYEQNIIKIEWRYIRKCIQKLKIIFKRKIVYRQDKK